jgi:predicted RNA-binding Zn ribbon-like protein
MNMNKQRKRGTDPAFPRLLGERLCLDFINTVEGPRSMQPEEFLHSYGDVVRWGRHTRILTPAAAEGLLREGVRRPDEATAVFGRASALRAALTRIFRAVARGQAADDAGLQHVRTEYLNALARARLTPRQETYGWTWNANDSSLDQPLWTVAHSAVELLTTGELARVKECPGADDCGWLFYDTSKNGSRRWCSMEGCGSRVKMRHQYARARSAAGSTVQATRLPDQDEHAQADAAARSEHQH